MAAAAEAGRSVFDDLIADPMREIPMTERRGISITQLETIWDHIVNRLGSGEKWEVDRAWGCGMTFTFRATDSVAAEKATQAQLLALEREMEVAMEEMDLDECEALYPRIEQLQSALSSMHDSQWRVATVEEVNGSADARSWKVKFEDSGRQEELSRELLWDRGQVRVKQSGAFPDGFVWGELLNDPQQATLYGRAYAMAIDNTLMFGCMQMSINM